MGSHLSYRTAPLLCRLEHDECVSVKERATTALEQLRAVAAADDEMEAV